MSTNQGTTKAEKSKSIFQTSRTIETINPTVFGHGKHLTNDFTSVANSRVAHRII